MAHWSGYDTLPECREFESLLPAEKVKKINQPCNDKCERAHCTKDRQCRAIADLQDKFLPCSFDRLKARFDRCEGLLSSMICRAACTASCISKTCCCRPLKLHRVHFPHLGDGPHPGTQRHLREKNQNRQAWLGDLRRRMA